MDKTSLLEWLREFKPARVSEHRRLLALPGVIIVVLSIIASLVSFLIMIGVTPIIPDLDVTLTLISINVVLVVSLLALIIREIFRIMQARRHGRAAARLHVRIVALFSLIAAVPAIVVAIVASVTLNLGLDRWFETNTRNIVNSSISLTQAYLTDTARNLQSATYSMMQDMDGQRTLY
ncbi:MAG: PAS domain-containing sensor histidine kinase, partial [Brucellaceae bacterium]|nr:PAS domain-containing sensor histidine kinase [Brucellaceae bacterium]